LIVSVPDRAPPLLAATTMVTVPLPLPDPDAIEIQETLLEADHPHAAAVFTDTDVPVDPPAGMVSVDGLTE
jgi:hypothetical protein